MLFYSDEFETDMESQWNQIDQLIAETTMPEEYQDWHVKILCSDCHQESMSPVRRQSMARFVNFA